MALCYILLMCLSSSLSFPSRSLDYSDEDLFQADLSLQFPQLGDSFAGPEVQRTERDGGSHGQAHGQSHGRRSGRRNGQLRQQPQQNTREEEFQESRGGRQSGATGPALGVLNSPPSEDGSYNFK